MNLYKTICATLLLIISAGATALDTVYVPLDCHHVDSAEYSTGGGDKIIQYIEVLCSDKNGNQTLYIDEKATVSGWIKLGRWTLPSGFKFVKSKKHKGEIEWD